MGWKISDKPTVDPKDTDLALIEQDGNTRNTTWAKLKAFFLGTATLATTDQTIKGALNEVKASTDANTTSLSEKANPNLLINGAPSVWQRGTSFNNVQQYTADRWFYVCYTSSPQGSLTKDVDNSIKITNFNANQNFIEQIIETNLSEKLAGRKVTLSAEIKVTGMTQGSLFLQLLSSLGTDSINYTGAVMNNMVISQSDVSSDYKKFSLTITLPTTLKTLVPQIGSANSIGSGMVNSDCIVNIRNIKLELGSIATPFVPRLYGEELALCQRYYQVCKFSNIAYSSTLLPVYVNYPIKMRTNPTAKVTANINGSDGYVDYFGSGEISIGSYTNNIVSSTDYGYITTTSSIFSAGKLYDGFITLDAEIY